MSDLLFNVRFGRRHLQISRTGRISFRRNSFWDLEDEYRKVPWLEVYCLFGKHL